MLDINVIREDPELVQQKLETRDNQVSINDVVKLDERRRELIEEVESLRHERNEGSEKIGKLKREGKEERAEDLIEKMSRIRDEIDQLEEKKTEIEQELKGKMARLPNIPHESVPVSENEEEKLVLEEYGRKSSFDFSPANHLKLGRDLDILDFETGAKIAGSRFPLYKNEGASLEFALIQFMLSHQVTENGYTPIFPPFLVNEESAFTSGQLPKFEEDVYSCPQDSLYLNPTAETILVNMHRNEILDLDQLPKRYTAYTTCFRREAGSYGEEERGLIRTHQFNKVELFQFVEPGTSYDQLESLISHAEDILKELDLHYRKVLLPTSDLAQQSTKTIDLEVWLPAQEQYYEVSSCSNCEDFQARRGGIRYRPAEDEKPRYVHTLNGSGLATSRLVAAVLENNQRGDGSVELPSLLAEALDQKALTP